MLLNYCYWSPRGLRASHNKLFVHCVPRPFRRFPFFRGAAGSRSFSTVLFSRIERAPFGRNGWVIYQNGPSDARGFRQKISSFFTPHKIPVKRPFHAPKVSQIKSHAPATEGNFPQKFSTSTLPHSSTLPLTHLTAGPVLMWTLRRPHLRQHHLDLEEAVILW